MSDQSPVSYYPPRGGTMSLTFSDVCLAAIAVALWVAVLFGTNLI